MGKNTSVIGDESCVGHNSSLYDKMKEVGEYLFSDTNHAVKFYENIINLKKLPLPENPDPRRKYVDSEYWSFALGLFSMISESTNRPEIPVRSDAWGYDHSATFRDVKYGRIHVPQSDYGIWVSEIGFVNQNALTADQVINLMKKRVSGLEHCLGSKGVVAFFNDVRDMPKDLRSLLEVQVAQQDWGEVRHYRSQGVISVDYSHDTVVDEDPRPVIVRRSTGKLAKP